MFVSSTKNDLQNTKEDGFTYTPSLVRCVYSIKAIEKIAIASFATIALIFFSYYLNSGFSITLSGFCIPLAATITILAISILTMIYLSRGRA